MKQNYERELGQWINREKRAITLIANIGSLWYDQSVKVKLYKRPLIDRSPKDIIRVHKEVEEVIGRELSLDDSVTLTQVMLSIDLNPCSVDLGRLSDEWFHEKSDYNGNPVPFVQKKLAHFIGQENRTPIQPRDVVLYGFGRIGRLCAREILDQAGRGGQLRLRAIVTRRNTAQDVLKRADLLRTDSVHGPFEGTVEVNAEKKSLILNGHTVEMIAADSPDSIDYTSLGIDRSLVIDNTGVWRDREGLSQHLQSKGVDRVLLTAPGKADIPNIVFGVNHKIVENNEEKIYSAASCTTNAIVPPLYVINQQFGIKKGHIETIHSYTNDQNLLDNYHKKYRRGRSAPLNMVITETGAAKAVAKALPSLAGKLTANAVRVPTPNASLAIMTLEVEKKTTREEVLSSMKEAALHGELVQQIRFSNDHEMVSSDVVGTTMASVFDAPATIVTEDGKNLVLYVWYDNEYGYTRQVLRLSKYISGVILPRYSI